jgi:hypothetical protein
MKDDLKQNLAQQSTWMRALYMVILFIVYSIAEIILGAVIIFQFLSRLLTGKLNATLLMFGADLSQFAYEILMFLTYNSDEKPFPFSEWHSNPNPTSGVAVNKETAGKSSKKRSSKKSKVTGIKKEESDDGKDSGNQN